ncbi:MAG: cytochrome d ubiquinol oxidase subunit II [Coriobacteriales bacterium]|nr:cytochrome d ubiquinol oxidase subunit II [Coriobacteriales bacterium]
MSALAILWFVLIAVVMAGYFVLDGFDLGVGVLYPFLGKNEQDKAIMRRAIGPVWDGNEVWLLTAGGALFAAFAPAYATSFSGFYLAIMLVLMGLILRAVSLEFRAYADNKGIWDWTFFVGSLLPALLFGVAVGNVMAGIPLNANGDYTGTFFGLLTPFTLICGVLGLVQMLFQGACWVSLKAPLGSDLRASASKLRYPLGIAALLVFVIATVLWFTTVLPGSSAEIGLTSLAFIFAFMYVIVMVLAIGMGSGSSSCDLLAFILTEAGCVCLIGLMAATLFPNLIVATDPALSITIASAAGSDVTLGAMTVIAVIGVPLVLFYHVLVYRKFAGRITPEDLAH